MKICSTCKQNFSSSNFSKDSSRKDGYSDSCKTCRALWQKEYRKKFPTRRKTADHKKYLKMMANNPQKKLDQHFGYQYGITLDKYNELLQKQNGVCAICEEKNVRSGKLKRLAVDHCHLTGLIRGLLCRECNIAIGLFEDNINRMEKAVQYLTEGEIRSEF